MPNFEKNREKEIVNYDRGDMLKNIVPLILETNERNSQSNSFLNDIKTELLSVKATQEAILSRFPGTDKETTYSLDGNTEYIDLGIKGEKFSFHVQGLVGTLAVYVGAGGYFSIQAMRRTEATSDVYVTPITSNGSYVLPNANSGFRLVALQCLAGSSCTIKFRRY